MLLPAELSVELALLPKSVTAPMQMTAMRATRRAYSTRLAPRSSREKCARMNGAQKRFQ